jgi:hypothetical protein
MNVCNHLARFLLKYCETQYLIGIRNVNQMMWHARLFLGGGLCCANIHPAIKETRIRRDDLAIQPFRKLNGDLRLADRSGTDDEDKRRLFPLSPSR